MTTQIWINDPQLLFKKDTVTQVWPTSNMSFETKINAITRLTIFLSILGFIFTMKISFLVIGIFTLVILIILYYFRKNKMNNSNNSTILEDFTNNSNSDSNNTNQPLPSNFDSVQIDSSTLDTFLKENYYESNKKNPMGNVLLTEISDTPNRKSAPPSFNPEVDEDINRNSKKMVQYLNPGIINTNKQLFGDLVDNYDFDWSMRNFYTMPNTRVTNDQGSLGQWLYSGYPSAKEGNPFAMVRDNLRYILI